MHTSNFSTNFKNLRKKAKLTQGQLGKKLGVCTTTIHDWEVKRTEPDIDTLKKISELFEITIDELINN